MPLFNEDGLNADCQIKADGIDVDKKGFDPVGLNAGKFGLNAGKLGFNAVDQNK